MDEVLNLEYLLLINGDIVPMGIEVSQGLLFKRWICVIENIDMYHNKKQQMNFIWFSKGKQSYISSYPSVDVSILSAFIVVNSQLHIFS